MLISSSFVAKLNDIQLIEEMFAGTMVIVGADNSNLQPLIESRDKYMQIVAFESNLTVIAALDLMVPKQYRLRFSCDFKSKKFNKKKHDLSSNRGFPFESCWKLYDHDLINFRPSINTARKPSFLKDVQLVESQTMQSQSSIVNSIDQLHQPLVEMSQFEFSACTYICGHIRGVGSAFTQYVSNILPF